MEMPDLNKPAFKAFPEAAKAIREKKCPACGKEIGPGEFRDVLSLREYKVSGFCQDCQDKVFGG